MLRKYVNGALHRWDDFVQTALWACRVRIHSTTGFSPFYLTYGREPRLPGDTLRPYIDDATFKDPRTVADITSRELAKLGQHRAAAEFRLKAMAEKDKARWDAAIKKVTFEPGDMVVITHEGRYGLEPNFKGPLIVVQSFLEFGTYKLQTLAGEPLKSLVHVDRLRVALGDRPEEPWYDPTSARREYNTIMQGNGSTATPLQGDHIDPLATELDPIFSEVSTGTDVPDLLSSPIHNNDNSAPVSRVAESTTTATVPQHVDQDLIPTQFAESHNDGVLMMVYSLKKILKSIMVNSLNVLLLMMVYSLKKILQSIKMCLPMKNYLLTTVFKSMKILLKTM